MTNEYDKIDNLFMHMWQNCICELEYDVESRERNHTLMDAAKAKLDDVLVIVDELMAQRDEYKRKLDKILDIASE